MRISNSVVVLAAGLAVAGPLGATRGTAAPTVGVPVTEAPFAAKSRTLSVATYDGGLRRLASTPAHWTTAGGNASEVMARATSSGRLLEFGGTFPYVSTDAGRTWKQVKVPVPELLGGEGAIVAGHGEDVYGAGWQPFTGDEVQGIRFTPDSGWLLGLAPVHTPVYDRPWVTYAKGPFVVNGASSPSVTVIHGGSNYRDRSTLMSTDGVTYLPTLPADDAAASTPAPFRIVVARDADADQWQPSPYAYTVPLTAGGLLLLKNSDDGFACGVVRLDPATGHWGCVTLPFEPTGTLRQDSRGWLTMLTEDSDDGTGAFVLAVSTDGGLHWESTRLRAPRGGAPRGTFHYDFVTNGRLGEAAVASRFVDAKGQGQDLVWRVDISRPQPTVRKVYEVGLGDVVAPGGADFSNSSTSVDRVDFPTVCFLPSGAIVSAFTDTTTPANSGGDDPNYGQGSHSPALVVLER